LGPITRAIPLPAALPCAGRVVDVSELRLLDLAWLQSDFERSSGWADPADDALRAVMSGGDGVRAALLAAYDRAEAGPPVFERGAISDYLATEKGLAMLLFAACREMEPPPTPEGAAALARGLLRSQDVESVVERERIIRKAFAGDPARAIMSLMGFPWPKPDDGRAPTWSRAIEEVAVARNLPNDAVYSMTLSEFRRARRGGGEDDPSEVEPGAPGELAAMERWNAEWFG
jgi:hypothetical protein